MGPLNRLPLDAQFPRYIETKDPCPVFDGIRWHLFGTGVIAPHTFELLHAVADKIEGPWQLQGPVALTAIQGSCVAAPGVIADGPVLHMFVQTDYNRLGGRVEHLVSRDAGTTFDQVDTALTAMAGTGEAGIYDPHPAWIDGQCYLTYSAFSRVGEPDIHLARSASGTWHGPWDRLGVIVRHEDVLQHNQRGDEDYEWGLEGAQLIELPDRRVLLNGVCFLRGGTSGRRQRVFFGMAPAPTGPYQIHGPVIDPEAGPDSGENGHAAGLVDDERLIMFFQERDAVAGIWRYGLAACPI